MIRVEVAKEVFIRIHIRSSDAASVQRKAGQRGGRVRTVPSPKTAATIRTFDYTQFTSVPRAAHSSYINHFGYENSAREANSALL